MNFKKLENLMNHFVKTEHAPGNTIQVYLGGERVFDYSCGYSDMNKRTAMTGNEHFYLYSCSKIATVTAALQLVERGLILVNDPLYDYIPEYRDMYIETSSGERCKAKNPIQIKNLFNMTAGFDYNFNTPGMARARELTGGAMDTDVVVRCMASNPICFEPGERFQYSLCHDVLAGLVSIVTGKKFRDYVKENIFDPLEMNDSAYHMNTRMKNNMAAQYRFVPTDKNANDDIVAAQKNGDGKDGRYDDMGLVNTHILGDEYDSGGAGIISTVSDYVKLAAALANRGVGLTGERILSSGAVELMRTNTLSSKQMETFDWKQLAGYGYGLGVRTLVDKAAAGSIGNIGEFGWGGAAGASVFIDPDIGLSAVYAKHTLNPREDYYQPRIRNVLYSCL